jgi:hypothetical protein
MRSEDFWLLARLWRGRMPAAACDRAATPPNAKNTAPPMGMCVKLSVFPLYDRFFWNHTAQNEGVFIIH